VQKPDNDALFPTLNLHDLHQHGAHIHSHAHESGHHHHHAHPHNHVAATTFLSSRRDFLRVLIGSALAEASILELAYHRAAWARAAAPNFGSNLFELQKVSNGVYFAFARPQAAVNCNAAIFVRSKDVVVVDAHSKPSAAASLIAQIKREITNKPVRYVINTHFHWDHTQGNHAYRMTGDKIDFIASSATKQLMSDLAVARMKASLDAVPQQIEDLRAKSASSKSEAEKTSCTEQIRQLQAYQSELKNYTLELPTITFDKSYLLQDPAFDLHLDFHGHAHTAGDVFVFCPQERALATGDASHCWLPFIADAFPHAWPRTLDDVARTDFRHMMGGHGPVQSDNKTMLNMRNYIEELTEKVGQARQQGLSVAEMQKRITISSLRSMRSNGYEASLRRTIAASHVGLGEAPPLQDGINVNISEIYKNLDRV